MSMKALEWAMYDVPAEMVKGALLRILLLLADHADTQGRGAFPSQKRIVALTGYSRRTIQNGLHDLEKAGLIRRGDQRITEHLGKYRPIVWDLAMKDFRGAKTTPLKQPPQEAQTTAPLNKLEGRNQGRKKTSPFMMGLCIDVFANTPGVATASMTLVGLLQPYLFELFVPRDSADDLEPSVRTIGMGSYFLYVLIIVLVYNLLFFTLETFNFFNWMQWLMCIGGSTVITMVMVMAIEGFRK